MSLVIVRVLVALAVMEVLHQTSGGVADIEGNRFRHRLLGVVPCRVVGGLHGVGFGSQRHIDHGVGQMHVAFGHAQIVAGLVGGHRDLQGAGVGHADVLRGEPHDAARHVQRVLAGLQHAGKPVHGRVRIGVAHGLVQGGDDVVVLLAMLVIKKGFARDQLFECSRIDRRHAVLKVAVQHSHLQRGERGAGVPVGKGGDGLQRVVVNMDLLAAVPVGIGEGAAEDLRDVLRAQGLQDEDLAAGEKRSVDLKGRIFGGSADQDDTAFFHKRKKGVLLRLVEAMDLVHKYDRLHSVFSGGFRLFHDGADLFDPAGDRREVDELTARAGGDDPRQCRLADAGRAPKDHGCDLIALDQPPQYFAGADQMLLSGVFVKGLRAQARRQRLLYFVVK